ncbi:unnamed protein product [Paramecium sonneborni]|uniref:Insulin-like growth factor binding protein, N-terminal n=1 Tax=Paramecium sonneborni TaxID=65129 RepID=A0A8S1RE15_9CILI|nr:unnamed protein product [Paramecium sonneborni]
MMMSIIIIYIHVFRAANYSYTANIEDSLAGWRIYNAQCPYINNCGSQAIVGGINSFNEHTIINRRFDNLDPHYQIRIDFWIWIIDSPSITDLEVQLDLDDYTKAISSQIIEQVNHCGVLNNNEQIKQIQFVIEHNKNILNLSAKFKYNKEQKFSWGIQKMDLNFLQCYLECSFCSGPMKFDCLNWHNLIYLFPNSIFTNLIEMTDNIDEFTQYFECYNCEQTFMIDFVQTNENNIIKLLDKFYINQELILEVYSNGTMQIDLIQIYGIVEFNFKIYSSDRKMEQQVQIQYLLKYQGNEILFPILPGCLDQFNNYCLDGLEGWDLNTIENVCFPICGNGVIERNEECDDGNLNNYDGCLQCKFECVQDCQICENGICKECNVGFEYDKQNEKCVTVCGDGLLIPFSQEICDDGNKEKGDGCYNCIFECEQFCEKCIYFDCVKCLEGFNLLNGICNPICGDKIVLKDLEECDDGNNISNDECHECKKVCANDCDVCEKGICQVNCKEKLGLGFYNIDGICKSKCGDSIVTAEEDCDDGNDIDYDGCFKCQYACEQNCLTCIKGQCQKYKSVCGNALLEKEDGKCDDGNTDQFDGCFFCDIEPNWICQEDKQKKSYCQNYNPHQFIPSFLNITNNKQFVLFQFSREIKIQNGQNLTQSMNLSIMDNQIQYKYEILEKIEPIENQLTNVYYLIQIEIQQKINFQPTLIINFTNNIVVLSDDDQPQALQEYKLILQIPQYLNQKDLQTSQNITNMSYTQSDKLSIIIKDYQFIKFIIFNNYCLYFHFYFKIYHLKY